MGYDKRRAGKLPLRIEPGGDPAHQARQRFAAVRRGLGIAQPFRGGLGIAPPDFVEPAAGPGAIVAVAKLLRNNRLAPKRLRRLPCPQLRARPASLGVRNLPGEGGGCRAPARSSSSSSPAKAAARTACVEAWQMKISRAVMFALPAGCNRRSLCCRLGKFGGTVGAPTALVNRPASASGAPVPYAGAPKSIWIFYLRRTQSPRRMASRPGSGEDDGDQNPLSSTRRFRREKIPRAGRRVPSDRLHRRFAGGLRDRRVFHRRLFCFRAFGADAVKGSGVRVSERGFSRRCR